MKSLITFDSPIKKYYVGFTVMAALVVIIVLITVVGNAGLKHDYELESTINDMQSKIDGYISQHKELPKLPLDAGITDTKGVDYQAVGDNRYLLCADFRSKSDGYTEPSPEFENDVRGSVVSNGVSLDAGTHFSNGGQGLIKHEKGHDCIVYEPYQLSDIYTKPYQLCKGTRYKTILGNQVVVAVDTTARTIDLRQYVYTYTGNNQTTVPAYQPPARTYDVKTDAKLYDNSCKSIKLSDLKTGMRVNIYQNDTATYLLDGLQIEQDAPTQPTLGTGASGTPVTVAPTTRLQSTAAVR